MTDTPEILVVCTHNAGRSVAARVLLDPRAEIELPVEPHDRGLRTLLPGRGWLHLRLSDSVYHLLYDTRPLSPVEVTPSRR